MNPITFNRELKDPHDFDVPCGIPWRPLGREVLNAPIFVWDDFEDDKLMSLPDDSDVFRLIETTPNLLPFKSLRLFIRANSTDSKRGTSGIKVWLQHRDGILDVRAKVIGLGAADHMFHMQTVPGYLTAAGRLRVVDRFVDFDSLYRNQKQAHERVDSLSRAIRTSVSWFIREVSSPRNFIATVSPDKKGKSVEWTKARTHYVLINKAHPANRKDVATGAEVVTTDAHIKRQAHSRRAHARVLRSPRFRNKQGQIIHIAACWVGPQEWKEPGGIYRLVSPRTSRAV